MEVGGGMLGLVGGHDVYIDHVNGDGHLAAVQFDR